VKGIQPAVANKGISALAASAHWPLKGRSGMRLRGIRHFLVAIVLCCSGTARAIESWELVHSQGVMHFVYISAPDWKNQDYYRLAIGTLCARKRICQVLFWHDRALTPTTIPMSDAQVEAKVAHWQYNANTGLRRLLWSCKIVSDPSQCF